LGSDPALTPVFWAARTEAAFAALRFDVMMRPVIQPMKPSVTAPSIPQTSAPSTMPATNPIHIIVHPQIGV
jgi:hypothetical protein